MFVASRSSKTNMAKMKILGILTVVAVMFFININKSSAETSYESCINAGGGPSECNSLPGAPTDTTTSTLPTSGSAYETCIDSGGTFESCAQYDTTATATTTTAGTTENGKSCYNSSDCKSKYCSETGSDYNSEFATGTCRESGTSGTAASESAASGVAASEPASGLTGNGIDIPKNTGLPDPQGGIKQILTNLLTWLLGIVGIIALIGFVISGIQYIISTGDDTKMETAKKNMTYSIIGIIVALAGFVIVQAIDFALRGMSF
jgi:hypothetical protein